MTEVFLEREFEFALTAEDVWGRVRESGHCFVRLGVHWYGSLLAVGGRRMLCHFSSQDAESVRIALRQSGGQMGPIWSGTVHEAPSLPGADPGYSNVVVTRSWAQPVELAGIQAIENAGARCLEAHDVQFVRSFFANDRRRMACLYRAPDAESVRLALVQAGMQVERVWAFEALVPP
ncbi:MAG: DUF4242 domain-containing protein [Xanthomonadales bacterium]|nr:DUF4242 domain-containing protein [Xanthomonadales bacterium]